jgi:hypothetical protein
MNPIQSGEKKEIFVLDNQKKAINLKTAKDNSDSVDSNNEEDGNYKTGRWHPNEHKRFIRGCLQYGNNWKKVNKNLIKKIPDIYIFFNNLENFLTKN